MLFREVTGQEVAKNTLRQMVEVNRLPHALLFLGSSGSGKLALAIALAQYILCEKRADGDACGHCASCLKASKLVHPDLHFSFPTVGTNALSDHFIHFWRTIIENSPYLNINQWLQTIGAENRQGNINKEECVSIIKKLSLKSFEGSHKVLIIWLPEYLGREGNRLLKLIEEPPENTVILLVAEDLEKILNTILSRCQIVKLSPLRDQDIMEGLSAKTKLQEDEIRQIAFLAEGDFGEALSLAENTENDHAALFLDWMRKCYKGNGVELVRWVENFATIGRENQKHFLQYGLHFMREFLVLKLTENEHVRLPATELKTAKNLIQVIDFDQIESITKLWNDCYYYIERNANAKVLFLDTSIQMHKSLRPSKYKVIDK